MKLGKRKVELTYEIVKLRRRKVKPSKRKGKLTYEIVKLKHQIVKLTPQLQPNPSIALLFASSEKRKNQPHPCVKVTWSIVKLKERKVKLGKSIGKLTHV
ncbi:hypothetical protein QWY15_03975 [Planococcus sp. N064]|uniref:Uncharacterized protein n=1 Tax=Planococcus liqunii TaxID=3058394 RepID=A0ABT8MNH7_9BACL|nr:hypothetical protein [Planococcus sp. N064]MDN7226446.1 hypothetical protein [Planococcus sp. N064]